jgi:cyclic-di-GMP-binding biofilm dispersal mediator protein
MTSDLQAKKALVVGGSRGIGAAIVARFAAGGADVTFTYSNSDEASIALTERTGAAAVKADSADRSVLTGAVSAAGPLDILVVNSAVGVGGDPRTLDYDTVDLAVRVNLLAPYVAAAEAARTMRDGGRIIFIGSCVADLTLTAGANPYAMTKAGLQGLVRGMARDLGRQRITVNLVQPGPTDTDMNPAAGPRAQKLLPQMAVRRYIKPEEIAEFVAYLSGPHADMITGAIHTIDGGHNA